MEPAPNCEVEVGPAEPKGFLLTVLAPIPNCGAAVDDAAVAGPAPPKLKVDLAAVGAALKGAEAAGATCPNFGAPIAPNAGGAVADGFNPPGAVAVEPNCGVVVVVDAPNGAADEGTAATPNAKPFAGGFAPKVGGALGPGAAVVVVGLLAPN